MDFSGCDYLWRQSPDLPRRLIKGAAVASVGESVFTAPLNSDDSSVLYDRRRHPSELIRRLPPMPLDSPEWLQTLKFMLQSHNSDKRQGKKHAHTNTPLLREVPRRSPSGNGGSLLSGIQPAPCTFSPRLHYIIIFFFFAGHLFLFFPRPTSVIFVCAAQV